MTRATEPVGVMLVGHQHEHVQPFPGIRTYSKPCLP
jgi:hypothetical protein